MIKVIVNGYLGKMGSETVNAVNEDSELTLVAKSEIDDDLQSLIKKTSAEVVVDFTAPKVVLSNVMTILNAGAHAVVGTTGFSQDDLNDVANTCKSTGKSCFIAPNFAIGAVLLMELSKIAAKYMPYCEIIELHHNNKKDAPSGTAFKTAQLIEEVYKNNTIKKSASYDATEAESPKGVRGGMVGSIPVHSIRLEGFIAHQEVIFGEKGQHLSIRHDTTSRSSFMPGVILAVKEIMNRKSELIYGLEKLLF